DAHVPRARPGPHRLRFPAPSEFDESPESGSNPLQRHLSAGPRCGEGRPRWAGPAEQAVGVSLDDRPAPRLHRLPGLPAELEVLDRPHSAQPVRRPGRLADVAGIPIETARHGPGDNIGHYVVMRIVSLLPSATEIVYALNLGAELVGITHECDWPPQARSKRVVSHSTLPTGASPAEVDRLVSESIGDGALIY